MKKRDDHADRMSTRIVPPFTAETPLAKVKAAENASVSSSDEIRTEFSAEFLFLMVRDVGWNDLGEPSRVLNTLAQLGLRPKWLAAWI